MKTFIKFLEEIIESNSTFMSVCDAEQCENPGARFPYKKYFTSLGEIQLAKKILRNILKQEEINNTPKSYKNMILNELGRHLDWIDCIEVVDHSESTTKIYRDGDNIKEFLDYIDWVERYPEYPRFEILLWTRGYWYAFTPYKMYKNCYSPLRPA